MTRGSIRRWATPALSISAMVVGLAVVAASPASAAAGKHKSKVTDRTLYASASVNSSKHKHLTMSVNADKPSGNDKPSISLTASDGTESHTWSFPVKSSAVQIKHGAGKVTLSKKTSHGYAIVKLKVTKAGKTHKGGCTQSTKSHIRGVVYLNTKSKGKHAWGKLGGKHSKISLSGGETDSLNKTCGSPNPCSPGSSWSSNSNSQYIFGGSQGKKGYIDASRSVKLGKYGSRFDSVDTSSKAPSIKGSGKHTTYTVKGKGAASGKLVIKATAAPSKSMQKCKSHGKKTKETNYSYYSAKGSSHGFVVHADIFGSFKPSKSVSFYVTKL